MKIQIKQYINGGGGGGVTSVKTFRLMNNNYHGRSFSYDRLLFLCHGEDQMKDKKEHKPCKEI